MHQTYINEMHKLYNTKQFHKLHKHIWLWLSNNPAKDKEDWIFKVFSNKKIIKYIGDNCYCFACLEYNEKQLKESCSHTNKCPIQWSIKNNLCTSSNSLFNFWSLISSSLQQKSQYAYQISKLEWKD